MLKCLKCGEENAFGRVFCANCGTKLDLTLINGEEIEEMGKEGRWLSYWPYYLLGLVVLLLAAVGLALWPLTDKLGEVGNRSDASVVKGQMLMLKKIGKGQMMQPAFSDRQINAYIDSYVLNKLGFEACSVAIADDVIKVRLARSFGPYGPASYRMNIHLVIDAVYAADGDKMVVQGGALGHLPMPGPLAQIPHTLLLSAVGGADEWKSMEYLKEISIENGRLNLRAAK